MYCEFCQNICFVTSYLPYSYFLYDEIFKNQNTINSQWLQVNGTKVPLTSWKAVYMDYDNLDYVSKYMYVYVYTLY